MTKEQSSGAPKVLDTTREAVERLARAYDINAGEVMHSDTSHTADTLRALLTRAEVAETERDMLKRALQCCANGALTTLDKGQIARQTLATLDQSKEGKDDE